MKKNISIVAVVTLASLFIMPLEASAKEMTGKELAFDRKLGNCLACHSVSDGGQPGNIGPPLIAMKARFPDKAVLRAQIWDATVKNSKSLMPPFGKHKVLTENQIDKVTDFIHSL
ncbi:Sulfur oxidation cycle carrier protein SoxY-Cys110-persulfide--sulfur compound transferase, SoxX subunit [Bathymodiolus brooksi thiotrophic gill symbiont]|jgi:sulfur-oxidizing protein SoxX|nr:Sulfur oxidation cycle carrier protein SoxY-Cys110-persulfide--sulfur compound transferase, SoxX subunit [Bathymodiolus brooksi thiotrophic gill symbiont]CAC9614959.1 Sulfur oxidation cycle carrier protein SoxY-Cys110-persulfide--sulfur compound transferase, SoxX subunit [uncultured Gammaproteobacteria bacterium]CAB9542116.1 Sulfur oxidation cycle carrier protein SoxY-Cys110-persulfide--sulfur compound transferase, SoxX subunit [Bathymodiolus brooksi thiotrophic gill symbiont]CAC9615123.1 Sul